MSTNLPLGTPIHGTPDSVTVGPAHPLIGPAWRHRLDEVALKRSAQTTPTVPPGVKIEPLPGYVTEQQFERLLAFLALSPEERAFIQALLEHPDDVDFYRVLADYLEEQGRAEASGKFRKLAETRK